VETTVYSDAEIVGFALSLGILKGVALKAGVGEQHPHSIFRVQGRSPWSGARGPKVPELKSYSLPSGEGRGGDETMGT